MTGSIWIYGGRYPVSDGSHYFPENARPLTMLRRYLQPLLLLLKLSKNVNVTRSVCNGSPITFYSLTLGNGVEITDDDDDDAVANRDRNAIENAGPGEIVDIQPPFSVNVILDAIDPNVLMGLKLIDGVAIPILAEYESKVKVFFKAIGRREELTLKSHGVDPSLSATFYKAQGRTMSRVIADLSANIMRMDYSSVFVFLSRVKFSKHAKILPLLPGINRGRRRTRTADGDFDLSNVDVAEQAALLASFKKARAQATNTAGARKVI